MHYQTWGEGDPVIALHPLALESTAFAGVARELGPAGLRTLAVDLPGFGRTPAPDGPLTPSALAAPVIELARELAASGERPLLLGMSLGGRVALEAALQAPELFRGVACVAPYLPWRRFAWALPAARLLDPRLAEKVPLEHVWPLLKRAAEGIESRQDLEHDWLARASVRVIYYWSCAATRAAFVSAARELALDPALGPHGTWTRMRAIEVPVTFLWCGKDALIPASHAGFVARELPWARQFELACSGHFVHGPHYRCFNRAVARCVQGIEAGGPGARSRVRRATVQCECLAEGEAGEPATAGAVELIGPTG